MNLIVKQWELEQELKIIREYLMFIINTGMKCDSLDWNNCIASAAKLQNELTIIKRGSLK